VGSYEAELHDFLSEILTQNYRTIVNVGCAEGYYAVGLARSFTEARVYAFDTDPRAQQLCEDMAGANGVADRVRVAGECRVERLRELAGPRTLIVCDCEGCEYCLLSLEQIPGLSACDLLIELHKRCEPDAFGTFVRSFSTTHEISVVSTAARDPAAYRALDGFRATDRSLAVSEFRDDGLSWILMTTRYANDDTRGRTPATGS